MSDADAFDGLELLEEMLDGNVSGSNTNDDKPAVASSEKLEKHEDDEADHDASDSATESESATMSKASKSILGDKLITPDKIYKDTVFTCIWKVHQPFFLTQKQ